MSVVSVPLLAQVDPGADLEPGVLMSAQTITSETTSTTTTTHITKVSGAGTGKRKAFTRNFFPVELHRPRVL